MLAVLGPYDDLRLLVAWVAIGLVSVLVHEMGHALTYRRFGQRPEVVLYAMGGLTRGERGLPPARSLAVSLAGPAAELFALGLPALALARADVVTDPFWVDVLALAVFINVGWPLLNLVPVLPLDGGNVVSSAVELVRPGHGQRTAQVVSVVVAGAGAVAALLAGWLFLAVMAGLFGAVNLQALRRTPDRSAVDPLLEGYAALLRGDVSAGRLAATRASRPAASAAAEELRLWSLVAEGARGRLARAVSLGGHEHELSSLLRGTAALLGGDADEGRALLAWSLVNERPSPALALAADVIAGADLARDLGEDLLRLDDGLAGLRTLQAVLHHRGWFQQAATVGALPLLGATASSLDRGLRASLAVDVAASAARAGELEAAEGWLAWAVGNGWDDVERLDQDGDLASLRGGPVALDLRRRGRST